jgi:ATP-binding cassette, subfamily C, bacterial LapB
MVHQVDNIEASAVDPDISESEDGVVSPVNELIDRLERAFGNNARVGTTTSAECAVAIDRFLKITGWSQGSRRVFESMPHADSLETIDAFRTVLFHLGFNTSVEEASVKSLRNEFLPCFLRTPSGSLILIEAASNADSVKIFDPVSKMHVEVSPGTIKGALIFPEQIKLPEDATPASTPKWSTTALKVFRPDIVKIFFLSFIINIFALAPPLYVMNVYDKAIGAKSPDVLLGLTIGIVMIVAADFGLRQIRSLFQAYLGARLDEQANETAFRQLLHMPLSFVEDAPIGSQLTRLRQMTSVRETFTGVLATALFDLPFIGLFIVVTAMIGGPLVWPPLILIGVYIALAAWAIPRTRQLVTAAGNAKSQLNNLTVEAVSAQRAIRDLSAETIWQSRHRRYSADSVMHNMKARQFSFLIQTLSQALVAAAGVATLAFGTGMVIAGDLSAGALIAVMALAWRILGPIRSTFLSGLTLGQALQSIEQIDRLVKMPREREPNANPSISRNFVGHIVCENLAFRYPSQREPAIRSVSFELKPGQLMCLCGPSGSGKSTILRILLGLHQQQAGSVFVDGLDLRQLDKGEWRHSLGVAPQSSDLFYGTVTQNLTLAHPAATDEEIEDIARRFGIDDYYSSVLNEGLATRFKSGSHSSWPDALVRRIVLCRAFIGNPPIYLLDDPAANLDMAGEKAFLALLEERRKKSAIIMTTHRPSYMRMANTLIWLDRGVIRDMGPPEIVLPRQLAG